MTVYNPILSTPTATVVAEYESKLNRSDAYQSEAALEKAFIKQLESQGYEYLTIHNEDDLIKNLRTQLEKLNKFNFTDKEWEDFFNGVIANKNASIADKSKIIQEDYIQSIVRENGQTQNIKLIDKDVIFNNFLQVINQYEESEGTHNTRYDVTILVNGLPLVHIELKRRGVAIKEAFNQIKRYNRDSFWAGCGLYEYVQLFVISNGTHTKYYSNTTRNSKIEEDKKQGASISKKKTSHSFEFTSYWADAKNKVIPDLVDFTSTFFSKHTLLNILTKYCVYTAENLLLVMRPYQIVATEKILNRIETSTNYKKMGTIDAGGYIWHTTGSGKTLTSFKTAQLATQITGVDKVIFVVDRKDLDYQTMKEYDRFEKGAANGNKNTKILIRQLEDKDEHGNFKHYPIIVTTIQKLNEFIAKYKSHDIYKKHVVLIFDECHRSQFGSMHQAIIKNFKNYHIFGFTGTPIFAQNSPTRGNPTMLTTEQTFGEKLHTYTIVDAINDGNVLPFRIDYVTTIKGVDDIDDEKVHGINTEKPFEDPKRITNIVEYIIKQFDRKTVRNQFYTYKDKRINGFNSIFAVSSIPMAKVYYLEFQKQLKEKNKDLSIATIFSFAPNEEESEASILDDEDFDTDKLDLTSRQFLDQVIDEYNTRFKTKFDSSSQGFENYYKDISDKMKKREIDLLIVVNMFLTGFDATTLNTLWVDKKLKQHGLIQAFSRTNRILNSVKTFGNIVCFRNLENRVNDAIALFGDPDASGIVILKTYNDYYYGYEDKGKKIKGYEERIAELIQKYPLGQTILGEKAEKDFIVSFGGILRLRNILNAFDEFEGNEILRPIDFQDYTGVYVDLRDKYRPDGGDKEIINDDLVFEMELVKQVEVNIDYILMLVKKYHDANCEDKAIKAAIDKAISASPELRSKKELIENFIESITINSDVDKDWKTYVEVEKEKAINTLIQEENLKEEETRKFLDDCIQDGYVKTNGTEISKIMPKMKRFGKNSEYSTRKQSIIEKIKAFFDRFFGLI